jgi:hypothetical protein
MGRPGRESNISEVGPRAPITDSGLRYLRATGVFVPTRSRGSNQIRNRGVMVYAYANNHYAGHAPAIIETFRDLWRAESLPELGKPLRIRSKESLLFE